MKLSGLLIGAIVIIIGVIVLAVVIIALGGEETTPNTPPTSGQPATPTLPPDDTGSKFLVGTIWNLTELNGQPLLPETIITAEFTADGRVSGSSGCNNYTAVYEVSGENININMSPAATTLKACPSPVMDQEEAYLAALGAAASFDANAESLILYDGSGSPLTTFAAVSQDLTGTAWQVISYNNGTGGVVSVLADTQITATFGEDGQLTGNASCNDYFGPYATEGNNIEMGPFGTTRELCRSEAITDQETQYLAALESAATYTIEGNTMNMRTADGATAVNFQRSSPQADSATVSGEVTNIDNAQIPEGAILTVQIQDTSLQDVAATVIGEQIIENPGQFPVPYSVGYDPNDITNPRYTMSARITAADGSLLFINDTSIPVITNGITEDVEIPVIQVGG